MILNILTIGFFRVMECRTAASAHMISWGRFWWQH